MAAYLFISPWIIGFLVFTAGPMLASLYFSLTDYNVLQPPTVPPHGSVLMQPSPAMVARGGRGRGGDDHDRAADRVAVSS